MPGEIHLVIKQLVTALAFESAFVGVLRAHVLRKGDAFLVHDIARRTPIRTGVVVIFPAVARQLTGVSKRLFAPCALERAMRRVNPHMHS